jgi:hypothetical protein
LIQNLDQQAPKFTEIGIGVWFYSSLFWCIAMDDLKHTCKVRLDFTDSNNTFAMDNAVWRFCYIEDPDGTLIELVETHRVLSKKMGWYLDLRKRNQENHYPNGW